MKYACYRLPSLEYERSNTKMISILQDRTIGPKAEALLLAMNLDQKIGQMISPECSYLTPEDVKTYHIGGVLSCNVSNAENDRPADWVDMNDAYWVASMTHDELHLPIPVLHGVNAIHGNNNISGATIFPHNIGLGASNDPDLIKKIASVTAREVLATGVDWVFAPNLAVACDIRWGRTYESYAENTETVTTCGATLIEGLQADLGTDSVLACVKHWLGDGGTTSGIDQGETTLRKDQLESIHMIPYRYAIDSGALTIMVSLNSWNGDKCHGHKFLISDILKTEMQFHGFVVSNLDGIDYLSEDYYNAIGLAVNAGIDMFMVSEKWKELIDNLKLHVNRGSISMKRIDDAIRRILSVKFACGLFDKPRPAERFWSNHESFGGQKHRTVAREAVRKSLVLLKNDGPVLPLQKNARILVAGKNANNLGHQCGGFSPARQGLTGSEDPQGGTSVWEGISQVAPNAELSSSAHGNDADLARHDVAIIVIGELPYSEGLGDVRQSDQLIVEAGSHIKGCMDILEPYGKTLELASLHPEDLQTIRNVTNKGIPAIVVMISGRPLVTNRELEASSAFVAAWLPGSEGQGIADVLFGDYDFHGKLSFSWPADIEELTAESQEKLPSLFPRGYGLTYSGQRTHQQLERLSA